VDQVPVVPQSLEMHTMPRRTCPSCLSAVSGQITKCPYCGAAVPPEAVTGSSPAVTPQSRHSAARPEAPASIGAAAPDRAINLKAILIGLGVIVLGTVIGSVALAFVLGAEAATGGTAPDAGGVGVYIASLILGLGLTVFGAYLAARRAGFRELVHSGIVGLIAMLVGLASLLTARSAGPIWFVAASAVLTLPCAILGGQLARRGR
jgi:hypothetical protein